MSAIPDVMSRLSAATSTPIDAICDHLLVIDHAAPAELSASARQRKPKVVGTYRLLRQEIAERHSGFYSAERVRHRAALAATPGKRFLELGRSCVLEPYRDKRTVELLWHGIWTYVRHHRIDVMFGCASIEGTDPARLPCRSASCTTMRSPGRNGAPGPCPTGGGDGCLPAVAINPKLALQRCRR